MAEIISRYKNQGLDIDSLLESIEGKPTGAVPKTPKDKKKKKKRKNQDTKGKYRSLCKQNHCDIRETEKKCADHEIW